MLKSNIQGIVFDLDGTLADTEPLHMEAWLSVLSEQGFTPDHRWFERYIGQADRVLAEEVIEEKQMNVEVGILLERKRCSYHRLATEKARLFPGVAEELSGLQEQFSMAIATSSSRRDAAAVFRSTDLDKYFNVIVTADDVRELKPAPECYLLAADQLGLAPDICLAVEDSISGVTAARTAGMFTVGVLSSQKRKSMQHAHLLFNDIAQVIRWISGWLPAQGPVLIRH